ncbi:MAG: TlpA disulfide reductase family protein [Candidatus Omnitrophica bacterium]|nr:TlpA disulfide reductase family protein [Candidatus Omnitrophota bacterium]
MKKYLQSVIALVFLSFLTAACAQNKEAVSNQGEVLDFTFSDLSRNTVSLASFRDKQPVVLFFWTTWCPFCRKEIQALNTKYDNLKKDGWEILAVDAGEDARKVESYRNANGIKLDLFLDQDMKITNALEVLGVPTYVIINKKGRVAAKVNSFSPDEYKYLLAE